MHDIYTIGIPTFVVLIGILLNQRGQDKLEARMEQMHSELSSRIDHLQAHLTSKIDRVQADLTAPIDRIQSRLISPSSIAR